MGGSAPSPIVGTEDERRLLAEWVAACVERVLPVFESRRAYDPRPRMAVDAARTFAQGMIGEGPARQAALAAHAAARATVDPAARAAARAAGHAAATAHLGGHARHAAEYAVKAAGAADPSAGERERAWQYDNAPEGVRRWVFPEGAPT